MLDVDFDRMIQSLLFFWLKEKRMPLSLILSSKTINRFNS